MNGPVAAQVSAAGRSALGCVGLFGPGSVPLLQSLFVPRSGVWDAHQPGPWVGRVQAADITDEIVVRRVTESASWWEITPLGSPALLAWLLEILVERGARRVDWSEWLELTEPTPGHAELARLMIQTRTLKTAALLQRQYAGVLGAALARLATRADPEERQHLIAEWENWSHFARHLVEPWRVALAGPANVGKSTLLNALVGHERAITAPLPGTTRDLVTEYLAIAGWPVEMIDTAGLRPTEDEVEQAGMEMARKAAAHADLVLWLREAGTVAEPVPEAWSDRTLRVVTKIDLAIEPASGEGGMVGADEMPVSALEGTGLEELRAAIVGRLVPCEPPPDVPLLASPRLVQLVREAGHPMA
ncbi:MAG TPA: 50S ribosome-binding GTPase [Gemmatales bacterium]|nr:50S ribosome-binding GTPase [Gemmatales bacterium]